MQNAGTVMKEILDILEDIPRDLLDKARCVIVLRSTLKAALTSRTGQISAGVIRLFCQTHFGGTD